MTPARLRTVLALSTGLSSKHSARLCPSPRLSLRPWVCVPILPIQLQTTLLMIPFFPTHARLFPKQISVRKTQPRRTARIRSGSALSKAFPAHLVTPCKNRRIPSHKNRAAAPGTPPPDPCRPPPIPASFLNAAPFSALALQLRPAQLSRHPQLVPTSMLPRTSRRPHAAFRIP
ncbi:hypothetical protein B0H14DRAFT_743176 [Mycena olivaceomarginata]|nr:hypothetical protein B0H14DRAFT_743176 [Mycena olivaceomarginata]